MDHESIDEPGVLEFLDRYRSAFEAFDAERIADHFAYPCHTTAEGDEITVSAVSTRDEWIVQLTRLIGAYRAIGVQTAETLTFKVIAITSRLAVAKVLWRVRGAKQEPIYDFRVAYVLADAGDGLRITALAHDETRYLRTRLAASKGSGTA